MERLELTRASLLELGDAERIQIARVARGRTGYICMPTATPFQFPPTETFVRNYTEWIEAADRLLA